MEKKDARKRYTQMVLKQSLLKLLKEKPVNKITVKEVCELAQLNRATFYAHYSDCFALLESIENELIGAFEQSLRYVNSFDVTALIEAIYDMIDQNREACSALILGNTSSTVLKRMIALAKKDSIAYWRRELPMARDAELEMMYTHLSNGLVQQRGNYSLCQPGGEEQPFAVKKAGRGFCVTQRKIKERNSCYERKQKTVKRSIKGYSPRYDR